MPMERDAADGGRDGRHAAGTPAGAGELNVHRSAERSLQTTVEIGALAVSGCQSLMVEASAFAQASMEAGRHLLRDLYGARDMSSVTAMQMQHLQDQWERNLAYLKRLSEITEDTAGRMAEKSRMLAPRS
jgi:hypothetical protein